MKTDRERTMRASSAIEAELEQLIAIRRTVWQSKFGLHRYEYLEGAITKATTAVMGKHATAAGILGAAKGAEVCLDAFEETATT